MVSNMPRPLKLALSEVRNSSLKREILIRELALGDELDLLAIRNEPENYQWFFSDTLVGAEEHRDWLKARLSESRYFTLVAQMGSEVIGVAYLNDIKFTTPKVSISIKDEMKGMGVGTKLLDELIVRSKSLGFSSLSAEIKSENLASIRFFLNKGFILDELESNNIESTQTSVVIVSLNLAA